MKCIELTMGMVAIVDDEDFQEIAQYRWQFQALHGYAQRTRKKVEGTPRSILMHANIMRPEKGMDVDHINGNKLDNRRCNLRVCTRSQNLQNMKLRKDNRLGVKGVTFNKARQKYVAQITSNGKNKGLGYFLTIEEAKAAYDKAALEKFGAFARLN